MQGFCVEYLHMNPSCSKSRKSCPKCCHIHIQVAGYTLPSLASTMQQKAYIQDAPKKWLNVATFMYRWLDTHCLPEPPNRMCKSCKIFRICKICRICKIFKIYRIWKTFKIYRICKIYRIGKTKHTNLNVATFMQVTGYTLPSLASTM